MPLPPRPWKATDWIACSLLASSLMLPAATRAGSITGSQVFASESPYRRTRCLKRW
jgi:hypothetical protein